VRQMVLISGYPRSMVAPQSTLPHRWPSPRISGRLSDPDRASRRPREDLDVPFASPLLDYFELGKRRQNCALGEGRNRRRIMSAGKPWPVRCL
jgi:hypothetical protein